MSDPSVEVSPELAREVKTTQEMLCKYISRPPLSDKTLSKPPFRFIHDIVVNVIEETGFMAGVFSDEELKPSAGISTDDKRMFLNKLIITAMEATGESTEARPSKILAGKDPEKTNNLLQLIARGIQTEMNSGTAKAKLEDRKRSEIRKKKEEEATIPTRTKTNLEQKVKNPPDLISKTNKASISSKTTAKDTKSSKGEGSSGTTRNRMNSSSKTEPKIPLGRSTKNQPDPKVIKPSSETKATPAKNPRVETKSKPTSRKNGQTNPKPTPDSNQKRVIEICDEVDGSLAGSSVKVPSKSGLNLGNGRSSPNLAQIAKSASNISDGSPDIQELDEGTRPPTTLEKDPSNNKTTFILEESNLQQRPVTRSGFLERDDDDDLIVKKLERKSTSQITKEVTRIEIKDPLPEPDSLAMLGCDVVGSEISGDEEVYNDLYDQLCNPKPTTPTELDISDNEASEMIDLNQIGSDVSVCKSGSFTSVTDNVGDHQASSPLDDDDPGNNKLRAIESKVSISSIPEVPEDQILETQDTDLRDQEEISIIPTRPEPPPRTARPGTARPPAPSRSNMPLILDGLEDVYRPPEGKVTSVILDSTAIDDGDEDEAFVAQEIGGPDPRDFSDTLATLFAGKNPDLRVPPPEARGYLVNQIISTQLELEVDKTKPFVELIDSDKEKQMSRDNYAAEIEKLKSLIQLAAKNANPIAKLLDYVGEDVHIIEEELYGYREQNKCLDKEIELAKTQTKKSLKPLERELEEIEIRIKEKEVQIVQTNMNILRLEERVESIMSGLDRIVPKDPREIRQLLPSPTEVLRMINFPSAGDCKQYSSPIGIDRVLREERTNNRRNQERFDIGHESGDYVPSNPQQLTNWSL